VIYVFDSGPLIVMFRHYYPERFPTLWEKFDELIDQESVVSVKEVSRELNGHVDSLSDWVKDNNGIFLMPTPNEFLLVSEIFKIPHFQDLIRKQERLEGKPVADPFVIAKAKEIGGCVVTTEKYKPNSAKVPNVCERFGVEYMSLEDFMAKENWSF